MFTLLWRLLLPLAPHRPSHWDRMSLTGLTPSPTLFCSPKSGLAFKQLFVLSPHLSTLNSITSLSPCPPRRARLTACDPRLHGHLLLDDMSKRCSLACLPAPVVFHSLLRNSVLCSFSLRSLHAQFFPKALYVWALGAGVVVK